MSRTFTRGSLKRFLRHHGVTPSKFGKGHAKTLDDLFASVHNEEIKVSLLPLLTCSKVKIDIYCEVGGVLWYLVEGDQTLENGKKRGRSWKRSASEKIGKGETAIQAAKRCLEEELGLVFTPETEPDFYVYQRYIAKPRASNSFPGTFVQGPRAKVVTILHPSLFRKEGYDEIKDGKVRTHFHWERARDVWKIT